MDTNLGEEPLDRTAARVGRTVGAVRDRLRYRGESSSVAQGRWSIQEIADWSGYTWHQIARALTRAGVKPTMLRSGSKRRGRRRMLSTDQVDKVIEALGRQTREAVMAVTVTRIAAEVGVSRRWAYEMAARLDIACGSLCPHDADRLRSALRRQ